MSQKPKPPVKWGYCGTCAFNTRWELSTHRSGERMYQCRNCLTNWRAKVPQISSTNTTKK